MKLSPLGLAVTVGLSWGGAILIIGTSGLLFSVHGHTGCELVVRFGIEPLVASI